MKLTNFIKRTAICLYFALVAVLFSCTTENDIKKAVLYDGEYYSLEYETESEYIFEKIETECIIVPKLNHNIQSIDRDCTFFKVQD